MGEGDRSLHMPYDTSIQYNTPPSTNVQAEFLDHAENVTPSDVLFFHSCHFDCAYAFLAREKTASEKDRRG